MMYYSEFCLYINMLFLYKTERDGDKSFVIAALYSEGNKATKEILQVFETISLNKLLGSA